MRPLRWLGAGLLWIVAGLLGLVGAVLCVTVILLPIGIPVLMLARRMFSVAAKLVVPRGVRHPVQEMDKKGSRAGRKVRSGAGKAVGKGAEKVSKARPGKKTRRLRKKVEKKVGRRNRLGLKRP